jgi:hypothetical protein
MKSVLLSFLGMLTILGGVFLIYLFFTSLDAKANILLFIGSFVLIGGGVFLLLFAGKSDTLILNKASRPENDKEPLIMKGENEGLASKLQENNAMMADWKKTNETKNRLRMLEISAAAEDEK